MGTTQLPKLGYRPDEAAAVIGSEPLLKEMVAAGWITPIVQRKKLTLYSGGSLDAAFDRLVKGEYPHRTGM